MAVASLFAIAGIGIYFARIFSQDMIRKESDIKNFAECWQKPRGHEDQFSARFIIYDIGNRKHIVLVPISLRCKADEAYIMPYLYSITASYQNKKVKAVIERSIPDRELIEIGDISDAEFSSFGSLDITGLAKWIPSSDGEDRNLVLFQVSSVDRVKLMPSIEN